MNHSLLICGNIFECDFQADMYSRQYLASEARDPEEFIA